MRRVIGQAHDSGRLAEMIAIHTGPPFRATVQGYNAGSFLWIWWILDLTANVCMT